jgi:hypothetical protein
MSQHHTLRTHNHQHIHTALPLLLLLFFFSNRAPSIAADSQLLWSQVKQQSMTPTFPEA